MRVQVVDMCLSRLARNTKCSLEWCRLVTVWPGLAQYTITSAHVNIHLVNVELNALNMVCLMLPDSPTYPQWGPLSISGKTVHFLAAPVATLPLRLQWSGHTTCVLKVWESRILELQNVIRSCRQLWTNTYTDMISCNYTEGLTSKTLVDSAFLFLKQGQLWGTVSCLDLCRHQ